MQVLDKKSNKSKAFAISSVMKDKNLARVLSDAWDAPAGSTKNEKARSVLKSLNKVNNNYQIQDGAGGPGPIGFDMQGGLPGLAQDPNAGI